MNVWVTAELKRDQRAICEAVPHFEAFRTCAIYSSNSLCADWSGADDGLNESDANVIATGCSVVNAGQLGKPAPFGSPVFAKFVQ